jgi:fused signal recognition particle receptor
LAFFSKVRDGLARTRAALVDRITEVVSGSKTLDEDTLEEIEAILIEADTGVDTAVEVVESIRERARDNPEEPILDLLGKELTRIVATGGDSTHDGSVAASDGGAAASNPPEVILVVGVNGVGKTTTVGKIAHLLAADGKKVMVAACDTFRAAASQQLGVWAQRSGAQLVGSREGADPAAVAFDALEAARARGIDVLLVDTAGRLHTKVNLMEELKKIGRTLSKQDGGPHQTLLVVDATTGQNALAQARQFHEAVGLTGLALTKLDGTAKGGIVFALCRELKLPVKYIGVGEGADDLQPFDGVEFVQALLEPETDDG